MENELPVVTNDINSRSAPHPCPLPRVRGRGRSSSARSTAISPLRLLKRIIRPLHLSPRHHSNQRFGESGVRADAYPHIQRRTREQLELARVDLLLRFRQLQELRLAVDLRRQELRILRRKVRRDRPAAFVELHQGRADGRGERNGV